MHYLLTDVLISPVTGQPLKLVEKLRDTNEVLEGSLICEQTGQSFPIRHGIPYFSLDTVNTNATARRFGYQWKRQADGFFERETIYGESYAQEFQSFLDRTLLKINDLLGMRIADIGCGRGRLSRQLAAHGAEVFAIDISDSVEIVRAEGQNLSQLHVIQANLFELPFPNGFFDVIWSDGVIHHTPNPRAAFSALASKVTGGGKLGIYVYPQELSIYKRFRSWTPVSYRWPLPVLQAYCSTVSVPIYLARIVALRYQPYHEVKFRLFDTLACPYLSMHSPSEVTAWFEENQFSQVTITKPYISAVGMKRLG
jgi:SAM-dependent methyltransferase